MREPRKVMITGSFVTRSQEPATGWVYFTPCRLWVVQGKQAWACLAPTVLLDSAGSFTTFLTPTDTDYIPFCYTVLTPAGEFRIKVPYTEVGHTLKELLDADHPGPRPTHG